MKGQLKFYFGVLSLIHSITRYRRKTKNLFSKKVQKVVKMANKFHIDEIDEK